VKTASGQRTCGTIYTALKYQGETPLDYQHTLNQKTNKGQEGKINLFWGWVPEKVGGRA
jgi:hypothetical protein